MEAEKESTVSPIGKGSAGLVGNGFSYKVYEGEREEDKKRKLLYTKCNGGESHFLFNSKAVQRRLGGSPRADCLFLFKRGNPAERKSKLCESLPNGKFTQLATRTGFPTGLREMREDRFLCPESHSQCPAIAQNTPKMSVLWLRTSKGGATGVQPR